MLADDGLPESVIERHLGLAPARAPSRERQALEEEAVGRSPVATGSFRRG